MSTQHLISLDAIAKHFKTSRMAALKRLAEAGIKPEMTLDIEPYYDFNESFGAFEENPVIRGTANVE